MPNTLVQRYMIGKSASERVAIMRVWEKCEKRIGESDRALFGELPRFGRVACAFIAEMRDRKTARVPTLTATQFHVLQRHIGR